MEAFYYMKALVFDQFGGPEVLKYREINDPVIGPDDILLEMKAIGLNFADVYRRKGNYHLEGQPPYILGYEGAGIVKKVGSQVSGVSVGERVAFADVPAANAELVAVPSEKAIPIPEGVTYESAASLLLQGLTAHYLTKDSFSIKKSDVALVHAAAGGVGQLLTQIIKRLGGKVIGLTSSEEKRQVALSAGADLVFLYNDSWKESVLNETAGKGVDVVYESVGSTLMDSFEVTRIGGTVVFFGMAGGDPVSIDPRMLMDTSKTLTGGDLWNVLTSHEERVKRSSELFEWIKNGDLKITETSFSLSEGAKAHEYLESRKSSGKILLIP
ncbi:alcohol dehydrogenase [Fictibacillus phosphorivorans]|uniref:Alcohol dehydrogenase n=1 Tax=Fictibacillus phosphorivorans TaxID=1221500 RepID=A0A165NHF5_9BACL|nr:quinone oxidoreductase [Fictibacillus phosphorivorans]KZE66077.1 alcohol dehydrogenase [Fictibacillus phosphorivorans]